MPATASIVRAAGAPKAALLTRVPSPGAGSARDARRYLEAEGHAVLDTEIPHNKALYAHVWGTGPADLGAYDALTEAGGVTMPPHRPQFRTLASPTAPNADDHATVPQPPDVTTSGRHAASEAGPDRIHVAVF